MKAQNTDWEKAPIPHQYISKLNGNNFNLSSWFTTFIIKWLANWILAVNSNNFYQIILEQHHYTFNYLLGIASSSPDIINTGRCSTVPHEYIELNFIYSMQIFNDISLRAWDDEHELNILWQQQWRVNNELHPVVGHIYHTNFNGKRKLLYTRGQNSGNRKRICIPKI